MRKQVDKLVVVLALCLLAASWLLATEQTVQAQQGYGWGYTCLDMYGSRCEDTGDAACQYIYNEYNQNCDEDCEYCDSPEVFNTSVCVITMPYEYCTWVGNSDECNGWYYYGDCTYEGNGYCDCYYSDPQEDGNCDDGPFYYYYC